jgi:aminoacrylate hydrolase
LQERFDSAEDFLRSRIDGFPGLETELSRLNAVMTHDLRQQMAAIRTPTTVICAQDDQLTPPGMSQELAERIPDAQLTILERGGHFCPVTVPQRYNEVLLQALRSA